jgi:hypothetical protein
MNDWTRIGVVLSVTWALGAALATHYQLAERERSARLLAYEVQSISCASNSDPRQIEAACEANAQRAYQDPKHARERLRPILGNALLPIPFAWLLAGFAVGLVRWVKAGARARS